MLRRIRWSVGSLLLLMTSVIFASDDSPSISSDAVSSHHDLSINFLSQIFGTVGNVLTGTSGQMLGKLFYELNIGILVVAGLWLSYTIFNIVVSSASEGSFISGRNNVALIFLKIAIGTGALLPSPTTGYSVIQDAVMQVVVKGVELADMTWSNGLSYIQSGGAVWRPPATSGDGGSLSHDTAKQLYDAVLTQTFKNEVCMVTASAQQDLRSRANHSGSNTGVANDSAPPAALNPIDQKNKMRFVFPSSQANDAGCGSVNWAAIPGAVDKQGQQTAEGDYAYQSVYHVVYGLLPAAKQYACAQGGTLASSSICDGVQSSDLNTSATEILFNNLLAYVNTIEPLVVRQSTKASTNLKSFLTNANDEGWISAGRYSWDISHLKDTYQNTADFTTYVPEVTSPVNTSNNATKDPVDTWLTQTAWPVVGNKFNNYSGASSSGDGGSTYGSTPKADMRWIAPIVGPIISYTGRLMHIFSDENIGDDPMYFLHRVGVESISIAGEIWVNLAVTVGALYLIGIFCSGGSVDLDRPIEGAVGWFKPLAMALAGMYITVGGMLTYYVPVYAFLVFSFAVISWFIAVIEAMVAAPLVAFGMTHPEGHDFLGPIKQALMLLLGIFLRPVLTVIGLIAAIILSFVSFRMINYGFASFMNDIFMSPTANTGDVMLGLNHFISNGGGGSSLMNQVIGGIIGMPILLFMYAMVVYYVVNQCYSMVYVLPDYILRWIGGPQQQSGVAQMMEGIKSGVSQHSGQLGQAMGQSTVGIPSGALNTAKITSGQGSEGGSSEHGDSKTPKGGDGGGGGAGGAGAAAA